MTIRVGGVPENVNIPWYHAVEHQLFRGDVSWRDCPGGTGEMTRLLDDGEIDVALALTEGAIAYISKGGAARIVGTYVETPLIWGVHTGADSDIRSSDDLRSGRFAVSRIGSGSHLMSTVYAAQNAWREDDAPQFVVVGGLTGALEAFRNGEVDGFLWEKYMTKPLVDDGTLRRIDECVAPWPAFSILADESARADREQLVGLISDAATSVALFNGDRDRFMNQIEDRYGLIRDDIASWMNETSIVCSTEVPRTTIDAAISFMSDIELLEQPITADDVVDADFIQWT